MQVARQGKMLEGGVGGSIAPTAVSTLKRSGKMCARGVEERNEWNPMRVSG